MTTGSPAPFHLALPDDWNWVGLTTVEEGDEASLRSGTMVGEFLRRDVRADGTFRHGRSYYALVRKGEAGPMHVVAAVGGRGTFGADDGPMVVGIARTDPYPAHVARIRALADVLGFPLPHACFPRRAPDHGMALGDAPDDDGVHFMPARLRAHVLRQAKAGAAALSVPLADFLGLLVEDALEARDGTRSR